MKQTTLTILLLTSLLVAACGGDEDSTESAGSSTATETKQSNAVAAVDSAADEAIELGTDIKDLMKPKPKTEPDALGALEIRWEDLVPDDFTPDAVLAKYKDEIDAAQEGSKEERVLYEKIMGELNNAGPNPDMDGKKVRIPGFVSPLDSSGEMVGEFLLVPYYGSCIHSPPPPVNQTVMVSPAEGKSISMSKVSRPVWVVGELEVQEVDTDLATAGYQIKNAMIEPYVHPSN